VDNEKFLTGRAAGLSNGVKISDLLGLKMSLEILFFKMWKSAGRKAPDIDSDFNFVFFQ